MHTNSTYSYTAMALACVTWGASLSGTPLEWNGYTVFTDEHVEINLGFDGATKTLYTDIVLDEAPSQPFSPDASLFWIRPNHLMTLPEGMGSHLSTLGEPGDEIYLLPSTYSSGKIYHGFSAYGFDGGQIQGNMVPLELVGFEGPGDLVIWDQYKQIDTGALDEYNTIDLPPAAHLHFTWGFTERGIYRLTFEGSGNLWNTDVAAASEPSAFLYLINPHPHQWWQVRHFGYAAVEPIAAMDAPPGPSGIPNLIAYAFDLNPAAPAPSGLPQMEIVDAGSVVHPALRFRFPGGELNHDDRSDLVYSIEASVDLTQPWTTLTNGTDYTLDPAGHDIDGTPLVRAVLVDSIEQSDVRFLRVRVTLLAD